jgi:hypothetical protein
MYKVAFRLSLGVMIGMLSGIACLYLTACFLNYIVHMIFVGKPPSSFITSYNILGHGIVVGLIVFIAVIASVYELPWKPWSIAISGGSAVALYSVIRIYMHVQFMKKVMGYSGVDAGFIYGFLSPISFQCILSIALDAPLHWSILIIFLGIWLKKYKNHSIIQSFEGYVRYR